MPLIVAQLQMLSEVSIGPRHKDAALQPVARVRAEGSAGNR